jgi:hypothetical protein
MADAHILLAPPNPTATVVGGVTLGRWRHFSDPGDGLPFEGMIRISSEPMLRAISHLANENSMVFIVAASRNKKR